MSKWFHTVQSARAAYIKFIDGLFADLRSKDEKARREINATPNAEQDMAPQGTQFSTNDAITLSSIDVSDLLVPSGSNSGKITLFYIGISSYTDAYNLPYKTEFCYFYFGNNLTTWHICQNNNSIK